MSRIANCLKKARMYAGVKFKQQRLFVPVGCELPRTAKDSMARQLLQAGIITQDDYDKMLGVTYDVNVKDHTEEDFSDEAFSAFTEFKQSSLAEYEDFEDIDPVPPVSNGVQSDKAGVPVSDDTAASGTPNEESKEKGVTNEQAKQE